MARMLGMALLALLATAPVASAAPPVNSAGHCLTPAPHDRHEPPCNPYAASTAWSTNHRSSYAQGSSPFPGPHPGDEVLWQDLQFGNEIPVILQISEPYPDGGRTVWFTTVSSPETRAVYKIDYESGAVLDRASVLDEGGQPQTVPSTSGVYNLLDRDNHLISVRENGLAVYGDTTPGVRTSPITLLRSFELPQRARCRPNDRIIGITLTYTGEVAFATVQGMVGVVPREPARMNNGNLAVASINGRDCDDSAVSEEQLEEVSNSISADEDGGIYVVSTREQYRFDYRDGVLTEAWHAPYSTGGGAAGSTLTSGSGSTPDVVGTDPRDDKLVAITDGQRLMHLTLFWRDRIPSDWKGLPGRARRIACEFPVRFGDPNATESVTEQSVLTRGNSFVVVNNALALDRAFTQIPPALRPLSALTGNLMGNGPRGLERIDWDPRTRTCRSVWANPNVSIPNSIPTMSAESGLVYGAGVKNGFWGLEGVDFKTGESKLFRPTTPLPSENSFFAATTVGPDGDIWIGGTSGISVFRGGGKWPAPRHECKDLDPPRSRVSRRGRKRSRLSARRLVVRGRAVDAACGLRRGTSVVRVDVAIAKRVGGRCRHLGRNGRLARRVRRCGARRFIRARLAREARGGARRFGLRRRARLRPGRYVVVARARDKAGSVERPRRAVRLRVRSKKRPRRERPRPERRRR